MVIWEMMSLIVEDSNYLFKIQKNDIYSNTISIIKLRTYASSATHSDSFDFCHFNHISMLEN